MKQNEILKIYGTEYKEITRKLLDQTDLYALIPSADAVIGIKPNLVTPTPASYGATTHPEIMAAIIEYLKDHGFHHIVVPEGSWVGDKTGEAFEYCGYRTLAEQYGVKLLDTQKDGCHTADCAGMKLKLCDCVEHIDFLINVPVLKGHCQTKITCALKNMKGLIPNSEKRRFHTMGLHKPIAHLGAGIRQDFIVVDHICGDLDFEEGGNPVVRNCVMAAKDPVLMDAYVCRLLRYDVKDVPYIGMAERLGVGCADLSQAEILTIGDAPLQEEAPAGGKVLNVKYHVQEVDSCSACYGNLLPALDRLRAEGLLDRLDEKISIGQGFQGQTGTLGVGTCTKQFDFCIEGCPPDSDEIYEKLKEYIVSKGR